MSLVVPGIKTYQSILGKYQVAMRTYSKKQKNTSRWTRHWESRSG